MPIDIYRGTLAGRLWPGELLIARSLFKANWERLISTGQPKRSGWGWRLLVVIGEWRSAPFAWVQASERARGSRPRPCRWTIPFPAACCRRTLLVWRLPTAQAGRPPFWGQCTLNKHSSLPDGPGRADGGTRTGDAGQGGGESSGQLRLFQAHSRAHPACPTARSAARSASRPLVRLICRVRLLWISCPFGTGRPGV